MSLLPLVTSFVHNHASLASTRAVETTSTRLVTATTTSLASSTQLFEGAGKLLDYTSTAITFFTSIRIPAALIAGTSLAIMFTFDENDEDEMNNPQQRRRRPPRYNRVTVSYHLFALMAFLLSMNVVLTATATSTYMLLGVRNPLARSAYEMLRRPEFDFAFTSTRWSFFVSIWSFLVAVTGRMLVEFQLLDVARFRTATMLVTAILSLALHLLSVANNSLHCWPHMGGMTLDLLRLVYRQATTRPLGAASLASAVVAVVMGTWAFVHSKGFANFGNDSPDVALNESHNGGNDNNDLEDNDVNMDATTSAVNVTSTDSSI